MLAKLKMLILPVMLAFFASPFPVLAGETSITFCYESENFPPFLMGKKAYEKGKSGILVEIAVLAAEKANLKPLIIRRPWKRCIKNLINGEVDGIFAAIYLPERESWGKFPKLSNGTINSTQRLWRVKYPVFQMNTRPDIWDGKKFKPLKRSIGTPLGYVTAKVLDEMSVPNTTIHNPTVGLKLVSEGKLDGYIVEENIGRSLINDGGLSNVTALDDAFLEADWFLPLSNRFYASNPKKSEEFWENISAVRQTVSTKLNQEN